MFSPTAWILRRFEPKEDNPAWWLLENYVTRSSYYRFDGLVFPAVLFSGWIGAFTHHPNHSITSFIVIFGYLCLSIAIFDLRMSRRGWAENILLIPDLNQYYWKAMLRFFWIMFPGLLVLQLTIGFCALLQSGILPGTALSLGWFGFCYLLAMIWTLYWSILGPFTLLTILIGGFCYVIATIPGIMEGWRSRSFADYGLSLVPAAMIAAAGCVPMLQTRSGYTDYLHSLWSYSERANNRSR